MYTIDKVYIMCYNRRRKELIEMLTMNATDVRKNWSEISENAIREKPHNYALYGLFRAFGGETGGLIFLPKIAQKS